MIVSSGSRFTFGEALKATVLLLPQALLAWLPAAFFFALVMYRKDERPAGATVVPSLVAGTLMCVILVSFLSAVVVPRANEAYRSLVFETLERRALPSPEPPSGVSEMTWWELREQMAHATDSAGLSRAHARLQERLAFVALVPVLALLGYGLSNRGRSRRAMFAVALAVQTLYYVCFSLGVTAFAKPYLPGPWIVNLAFLILALLVLRPSSTPRPHSEA
jgi:lipopolysaccharide export LptBFGC system permease protein LptF